MNNTVLPKYRIKELVEGLARKINVSAELQLLGITPSSYSRDLIAGLPDSPTQDIPGDRLIIYARFFGVTIEQLYTSVTPKKRKSSSLKSALS